MGANAAAHGQPDLAGNGTASFARELIDRTRARVHAVDEDARAREKRARRFYVLAVVGAVVIAVLALIVAAFRAETSAQDVAERVAPVVAERAVQDARTQGAANSRAALAAANEALIAQGLPPVQDPGPAANVDQLRITASTAQVLLVLPETVKEQLRAEGRSVIVLPLPNGTVTPGSGPAPTQQPGALVPGSGLVPGGGSSGAPRTTGRVEPSASRRPNVPVRPAPPAPAPPAPGTGGGSTPGPAPAPGPAPGPAPQPDRGGIRLDLPLLPDIELPLPRLLGLDVRA